MLVLCEARTLPVERSSFSSGDWILMKSPGVRTSQAVDKDVMTKKLSAAAGHPRVANRDSLSAPYQDVTFFNSAFYCFLFAARPACVL